MTSFRKRPSRPRGDDLRLDAHKIPWRNYYSSFPPTSYVFPGEAIEGHASLVKIEQFSPTPTTRNLPAMTGRDAAADLSDFLSLDQPPFAQPPRWPSRSPALPS